MRFPPYVRILGIALATASFLPPLVVGACRPLPKGCDPGECELRRGRVPRGGNSPSKRDRGPDATVSRSERVGKGDGGRRVVGRNRAPWGFPAVLDAALVIDLGISELTKPDSLKAFLVGTPKNRRAPPV
jgi:hypothetical protein